MRLIIFSILIFARSIQAGTIGPLYDNTENDTGFTDGFAVNGLVEAGDQITLGTAGGFATTAYTALYNSADVSGAADVTLRLYSVDSSENLGSMLLSSTLRDVNFT